MIKNKSESGQVAIVTVVIFMILFSIVVVSFTQLSISASHETVSDELRARAQASAEAGIEDAKRILTHCYTSPSPAAECNDVLTKTINEQTCTTIVSNGSGVLSKIGQTPEDVGEGNYQVKVGEGVQYYLCLKMSALSENYSGTAKADGPSVVVPLKVRKEGGGNGTPAKSIEIVWHNTSNEEDGPVSSSDLKAGTDFPSYINWTNANTPATLRVEFLRVPKTPFTIEDLSNAARAWVMRPTSSSTSPTSDGNGTVANPFNIDGYSRNSAPNSMTNPLIALKCSTTGEYACSFAFKQGTGGGASWSLPDGQHDYYLRVQAIYRDADFEVSIYRPDGSKLLFEGTQPVVDVTGRAQDAYQRIQANLEPISSTTTYKWFPEYAIDSGGKICKNLTVSGDKGTDNCTYD